MSEEAERLAVELAKPKPKKPKPKKTTRVKPSRDIKDPVLRSEAYMANVHAAKALDSKRKLNRLRELIEPETEAMVKVMIDIAKDADHKREPEKYKSIHPSIRLEAADRLMDRAYGKPKETIGIEDENVGSSTDEVMGLLNNIFDAVGLPKLEGPKEPGAQSGGEQSSEG